jgi:hypothetical protein
LGSAQGSPFSTPRLVRRLRHASPRILPEFR